MKKIKRCIGILVVCLLLLVQAYASPNSVRTDRIFPSALGINGRVTAKNVNIRKYPNKYAKLSGKMDWGNVKILGKNNNWYKIMNKGQEGWIHSAYVEVKNQALIPYTKVIGEEIVEYGMQFIGTPYVWGGSNLQKGVDCSGFTQEVYRAFDIDISRVSYRQAEDGKVVPKNQLDTGDLIFFDTEGINDGNISHVGIYVGNDQFLHSDGTRGVMVSKLSSRYYANRFVRGIRVL